MFDMKIAKKNIQGVERKKRNNGANFKVITKSFLSLLEPFP